MTVTYNFELEFDLAVPSECRAAILEELRNDGIEESSIISLGMIVGIKVPSEQSDLVKDWIKRHNDELQVI